ncbi:MAG: ADP-ribosyl-[dinitrogen reductase] hydrolase [gamma proteobacterium symbiont of Bathyaustriella thionipta]|nr:ADP-ribosyl-[dinitrogen reductase] hydrolase [gamma proteobacterium symbiont of Bathyaustriella thionipta]MCU7950305.1 ADP-ribosyl-[dinitrogen reductase] hydrolase [gamma proteobacterium symbiont of Bathyaustriella thionipta]MCU7952309.1 ADP-ribosyl-[dinitrogen reductase] hydrolase [gamma proteobacterium symbiont of Bathyaustriella thionipta]MCU7956824.1 ADP-ribosyl-[dinitrogen reductase] hydrolase [gamma proteobacterium symbiont of Bathyaustriella thionipta]MCU7966609.1 ADP-ribosyl-[dinitro
MNSSENYSSMSLSEQTNKQDRIIGAYIGLAIGDALGATTEFMTPNEIIHQYGIHRNIIGGGWLRLKPGQVTDDTEMSLALGQSIIDNQGVVSTAVAQAFSDWMRTKPIDIGNTVRRGIVHYRTSENPVVNDNKYDAGNGACMRALPVAIFHCNSSFKILKKASKSQSHTTHNNTVADAGTEIILKMLVSAFNGQDKNSLEKSAHELVKNFPEYRYDKRKIENPSGWIVETLQSVFQAFFTHNNFEDILIDVVNRGGDADTTGAIAGMLAGACFGKKAIPIEWYNKLDANVKDACIKQAIDLFLLSERELIIS